MTQGEIEKLFYNSKNKSEKVEKYFSIYEEVFKKYKNEDITIVEIGVRNGGSLDIWRNYFSKNSRIIGIDLNPECKKFEREGVEIFIGNQSDPSFWNTFFKKVGMVDIIVDDGGHTSMDQIVTLVSTVNKIKDGGILFVEDTHTSYNLKDSLIDNKSNKYSFIDFSKKMIDDINTKFSKNFKKYKFSYSDCIYSMQIFESVVIFRIDRSKCFNSKVVTNKGKDHNIYDLVGIGNDHTILGFEKFFSFFNSVIRLTKLKRRFKDIINKKMIRKFFK